MYPFLSIFGYQIPTYWMMAVIGILLSYGFLIFHRRHFSIPKDDTLHLFLFAIIGAIVGAKVLYLITMIPAVVQTFSIVMEQPTVLVDLFTSGYVFYGGVFGGFAACWWYCRRFRISMSDVTELFAPMLPFFHIFGRIGCFLAGCCYGISVPWGVVFTNASAAPNGVPLLPLQLIESGCNVLIFAAVLFFDHKERTKGLTLPFYALLYAVCRFVLEFFRGDKVRGILLLSTSQWISIGILLALAVWFFCFYRRKQKAASLS
jgi:phosphatidylglycerol:prolipoprotein diacylglycerol transferase